MAVEGGTKGDGTTQGILSNWRDFCIDMGNEFVKTEGAWLFLNRRTAMACDFSNCALILYESNTKLKMSLDEVALHAKESNIAVYAISLNEDIEVEGFPSRLCSIMVWRKDSLDNMMNANLRVVRLGKEDLTAFTDLAFASFGYENTYRRDSEEIYARGMATGRVDLYGVLFGYRLVGGALIHRNQNGIGIELVSTLPDFRNRGVATSLMKYIITAERQRGTELIWLFSNKGSDTESLYQRLGFRSEYVMHVIRLGQPR